MRVRSAARASGSVLLGIAIGLVAYQGVTGVVSGVEQRTLRAQAPDSIYSHEMVDASGMAFDFTDWENLDIRYWDDLEAGGAFGRIVADDIGLDTVVVKGHLRKWMRRGPGWVTYSDVPGPTGNVGIAGHRTTYGAPFADIDELRPGDTISFYSPYRLYRYRVVRTMFVRPEDTQVVAGTKDPMLTLTACHPPYSARQRIVVQSELVSVARFKR